MQQKLTYLLIFLSVFSIAAQSKSFYKTLDSIQKLRALSDNTDLVLDERLIFAKRASELSYKTEVDSTILLSDRKVAFIYINLGNHNKTREWSDKNLRLAKKLKDSLVIAYASHQLGWYYQQQETQNDSAFYYYNNALKLYQKFRDILNESSLYLNLGLIQESEKDFIGAETSAINAIKLLQILPEDQNNLETQIDVYNLIGRISIWLKQYDKALEFYKNAQVISNKLSNNYESNLFIELNIAELYKYKKEFDKSIIIYQKLLSNWDMQSVNSKIYPSILNNIAYAKFSFKDSDNNEIFSLFSQAYKIVDNLNASYETSSFGNDFAEYFLSFGQTDSAIHYLNRSYKIGKQINENAEVLRSLKLLSQAKNGEAGKAHLYEYIRLNDSIIDKERTIRNKFARIQFETNEIENNNKKITKDKQLLIFAVITLLATLLLLYLNFTQRAKNKTLLYEKEQQKANDEIYSLMLKQQTKLEEGRVKERHRISEELHDGILSKLFGIRISFDYLSSKINNDKDFLLKHKENIKHLQDTELEIRNIAHELNNQIFTRKTDFTAIIDQYVKDLSELHLFEYHIKTNGSIYWEDIDDKLKVNLYRIIQESIHNIIKHAQANTVNIDFAVKKEILYLTIKDDGIGFDCKEQYKGIGLKNIKARTSKINGKTIVKSSPGKGTTVTAMMVAV